MAETAIVAREIKLPGSCRSKWSWRAASRADLRVGGDDWMRPEHEGSEGKHLRNAHSLALDTFA